MKRLLLLFMLAASPAAATTLTFMWTAPGDDGNIGTALRYEMRWSPSQPDTTNLPAANAWWTSAIRLTNLPAPLLAGTVQSFVVTITLSQRGYFVIRTTDDVGNISGFSNVAWHDPPDITPPAQIEDLR